MQSVRNMELDSVRNAVNVSTLIIAANALIQKSTVSSESNEVFGRSQGTEERKKQRWGDKGMRRQGDSVTKNKKTWR